MGDLKVIKLTSKKDKANYIHQLVRDIEALDKMINEGLVEKAPIRVGAEQEFCLVDQYFNPSTKSLDILDDIDDEHFTTEIGSFNLELNLDPHELKDDCFSQIANQLKTLLKKAKKVVRDHDTKILLTGILPTLSLRHIKLENMTDVQRYFVLNEAIRESRKDNFEIHIKGVDELNLLHDSVLLEGCNTSFQIHLQINPDEFIDSYNWAQAISGPILSVCTNSPLLFGKELWSETRIALFTQSVDTRANSFMLNEKQSRVSFGSEWTSGTATDIFKDNISRFRSLVTAEYFKDSVEMLNNGEIPKLKALNLHNGTVYRWNRPCYGVGNGKPHLRIENRYIPSGPTIADEIANMMFWVGVMKGK
ncbi:MAG: CBS domain-containing protein, partial [Bacteroidia bacterium]|nr:CBS domain-containing protein [Bacteroidia bacterium]